MALDDEPAASRRPGAGRARSPAGSGVLPKSRLRQYSSSGMPEVSQFGVSDAGYAVVEGALPARPSRIRDQARSSATLIATIPTSRAIDARLLDERREDERHERDP